MSTSIVNASTLSLNDGRNGRRIYISIDSIVYDLTDFNHPGGAAIIKKYAGMDATVPFLQIHPRDLAKRLMDPKNVIGKLDLSTLSEGQIAKTDDPVGNILLTSSAPPPTLTLPPLETMLNAFDFEAIAKLKLSKEAWGYYSSGSDDEITLRENRAAFLRVILKPRIMRNVTNVRIDTEICGRRFDLPLYISATALGKLADPEGEIAIVKAAHACNVPYMLPTLSSCTLDEMLSAISPNQIVFSQLYVNSNRERTEEYVAELRKSGKVKALFVTVDAPQLGRREKDMRNKFTKQGSDVQKGDDQNGGVQRDKGVTRAISSFIDPGLNWNDVKWLKDICGSDMLLFLKGVQCGEDAVEALIRGCDGVVLSNHGGRQCDTCRSGLEVLPEVMTALKNHPNYDVKKFSVFVDGGIRRGADIFKAVALGAKAVGIGRPVLYSLASFGGKGVEKMVENMKEELEMTMRLMGTTAVSEIGQMHVDSRFLTNHSSQPKDYLSETTYEPLKTVTAVSKL